LRLHEWAQSEPPQWLVIPAKAGIQYAAAHRPITGVSGILDHPLVIGLAGGETPMADDDSSNFVAWMERSAIQEKST
jgi:hypothetical protein